LGIFPFVWWAASAFSRLLFYSLGNSARLKHLSSYRLYSPFFARSMSIFATSFFISAFCAATRFSYGSTAPFFFFSWPALRLPFLISILCLRAAPPLAWLLAPFIRVNELMAFLFPSSECFSNSQPVFSRSLCFFPLRGTGHFCPEPPSILCGSLVRRFSFSSVVGLTFHVVYVSPRFAPNFLSTRFEHDPGFRLFLSFLCAFFFSSERSVGGAPRVRHVWSVRGTGRTSPLYVWAFQQPANFLVIVVSLSSPAIQDFLFVEGLTG